MVGAKKPKAINFECIASPTAPSCGQMIGKKKKIAVPPGLGVSAYPDIKEPPKVTHEYTERSVKQSYSSVSPPAPSPAPYLGNSTSPPSFGPTSTSPYGGDSHTSISPKPYGGPPTGGPPTGGPVPGGRSLPSPTSGTGGHIQARPLPTSGGRPPVGGPPIGGQPQGGGGDNIPEWKRKLMERKEQGGNPPGGY